MSVVLWLLVIALVCVGFWNLAAGMWVMAIVMGVAALAVGWAALERMVDNW